MHGVLEDFWLQVKTHDELTKISDRDLELVLHNLSDVQLKKMAQKRPMTFTQRFKQMESKRLASRVKQWLDIERRRHPFEVIGIEEQKNITIEGLSLTTKIDRIDQLDDQSHMLIDYKTGQPQVKSWFSERPDEPQLPLYALLLTEHTRAVAFAQLKVGKMGFKGLGDTDFAPEGIELFSASKYAFGGAGWEDLLQEWQTRITQLALEFKSGVASVTPKEGSKTCQQCELGGFCRVSSLEITPFTEVDKDG